MRLDSLLSTRQLVVFAVALLSLYCLLRSSSSDKDDTPDGSTSSSRRFSAVQQAQIKNFIQGDGLILNIHITHHAGTSMCREVGKPLGAPQTFCNHPSQLQWQEYKDPSSMLIHLQINSKIKRESFLAQFYF